MPSRTRPLTFRLPRLEDTFSEFPDNGLNSHYTRCRAQSRDWINRYSKAICGPKMRAFMDNCNFELSTSYVYPYAPPAGLRATMDLVSKFADSTFKLTNRLSRSIFSGFMTSSPTPFPESKQITQLLWYIVRCTTQTSMTPAGFLI